MHGDALGDPHAESGDLALGSAGVGGEPDTAAALDPAGRQSEVRTDADQGLFESAHVVDDVHMAGELGDRVADELARAVPGDLAAAVDLHHGGAVDRTVLWFGAFACGVDRGCSSRSTTSSISSATRRA